MNSILVKRIEDGLIDALKSGAVSNAPAIIVKGMELLEKIKEISGAEKVQYLAEAVGNLTKAGLLSDQQELAVRVLLQDNLLQDLVSVIADASKGRFDINKIVEVVEEGKVVIEAAQSTAQQAIKWCGAYCSCVSSHKP